MKLPELTPLTDAIGPHASAGDVFTTLALTGLLAGLKAAPPTESGASQVDDEAGLSDTSRLILSKLGGYAVTLDELLVDTGLPVAELTRQMVELELGGFVSQVPLGYIRSS